MIEVSRRDFLSLCSILAASLSACKSLTESARVASSFVVDPQAGEYRPTLQALVESILPIHTDGFPLDVATVTGRTLRMFLAEDDQRFLELQKALIYFNQLDLSPHIAAPLIAAERLALDVPEHLSEQDFLRVTTERIRLETIREEEHARRYPAPDHTFVALPPEGRLAWWRLWSGSSFTVKREFARAVRALIMIAAYSADAMWPAIGYEGPLIRKPERGR